MKSCTTHFRNKPAVVCRIPFQELITFFSLMKIGPTSSSTLLTECTHSMNTLSGGWVYFFIINFYFFSHQFPTGSHIYMYSLEVKKSSMFSFLNNNKKKNLRKPSMPLSAVLEARTVINSRTYLSPLTVWIVGRWLESDVVFKYVTPEPLPG